MTQTHIQKIVKTLAFTALTASSLFSFSVSSHAVEFTKPKAVIELFTSQGCSSCPPADAALKQINSAHEVLGLAMHVDYWDRLGWKDTFASPEYTERQYRYAHSLRERQVYTPQAIINGRTHIVGSRKQDILDTVEKFDHTNKGMIVPVNLEQIGKIIRVSIPKTEPGRDATLYAFYFNPLEEVEITRGENAGRKLQYSNIVGKVEMIGMAGPNGMQAEFSIADMKQKGYEGCALVLQSKTSDGSPGPILGASVISDL